MKMELATMSPNDCKWRKCTSRPPEMRSSALGFAQRNKQRIFKQCHGVRLLTPASGVLSIDTKKFTGIEWTFFSFKTNAMSTKSSSVSPMPANTPEHDDK